MHYSKENFEIFYDYNILNIIFCILCAFISFDWVTLDVFFCEIHHNIALVLGVLCNLITS